MHTTWPEVVGVLGLVAIVAAAMLYGMKLLLANMPENQLDCDNHRLVWETETTEEHLDDTEQLVFYHCGDDTIPEIEQYHRWPFVYLHGEAEDLNAENTPEASDLCVATKPITDYVGPLKNLSSYVLLHKIECFVYDKPAMCVLRKRENEAFLSGRVALLEDEVGLAHIMNPDEWR